MVRVKLFYALNGTRSEVCGGSGPRDRQFRQEELFPYGISGVFSIRGWFRIQDIAVSGLAMKRLRDDAVVDIAVQVQSDSLRLGMDLI